jgi:hypothetical protein
MLSRSMCIVIVTAFSAGIAIATEPEVPNPVSDPPCACVAKGVRFGQGEEACLMGQRMTCGMNSNMSSWVATGEACQLS